MVKRFIFLNSNRRDLILTVCLRNKTAKPRNAEEKTKRHRPSLAETVTVLRRDLPLIVQFSQSLTHNFLEYRKVL